MSEEERKAIEYFEKSFEKRVPPYWYDDTIANNEEQIKILLNLIEKQQKELLKYKTDKIEKQQKEIEDLKKPKYIIDLKTNNITILTNDFISKNTIREKIKELEKEYKEYENTNEWEIFDETKYAYDLLKELLEGE